MKKYGVSAEKIALRNEYRRIKKNYKQMIRDDYKKYLMPKDVPRYIPETPAILTDDGLFRNAAVSRIQGAIRRLQSYINRYRAYRTTFERLNDAVLRKFFSYLINIITSTRRDINETNKARATRVLQYLEQNIKGDDKYIVSRRIGKRWQNVVELTDRYIFDSATDPIQLHIKFSDAISAIFNPYPDETGYFKGVWEKIQADLFLDDGFDDVFTGEYYG